MSRLPDKLSELITIALEDINRAEQTPGYVVDMGVWHGYSERHPKAACVVCAAGSVMAFTLNVPTREVVGLGTAHDYWHNERFDNDTGKKLFALNLVRQGYVTRALNMIGADGANFPLFGRVTPYQEDSCEFKRDMIKLAVRLEEVGL